MTISNSPKVAVIGAGVVGLTTTLSIQEAIPTARITVFADRLLSETVSSVAAGIFHPSIEAKDAKEEERLRTWLRSSWSYYQRLAESPEADSAGVHFVSGSHISSESIERCRPKFLNDFAKNVQVLKKSQVSELTSSPSYSFGITFRTVVSDPKHYLRWLLNKVVKKCNLVLRHIQDLETDDSLSDFDVIINCTGLGAKDITTDSDLIPVRGQTIRVYAPWIRQFTFVDAAYVIPSGCSDGLVTLGGIKQFDSTKLSVDAEDREWIWKKCTQVIPSLKDASIVSEGVGLRPFRGNVRVEKEIYPNGRVVIHNYGHGGNGYILSKGTAEEVSSILLHHLTSSPSGTSATRSKL